MPADSEPETRAGAFRLGMQAREGEKDALVVFRLNADSVVGDRDEPVLAATGAVHLNPRLPLGAVLDRVGEEGLEDSL